MDAPRGRGQCVGRARLHPISWVGDRESERQGGQWFAYSNEVGFEYP
jgi:hypothetical protein